MRFRFRLPKKRSTGAFSQQSPFPRMDGRRVGAEVAFPELTERLRAVFFAAGLTESYNFGIQGAHHPRVLSDLKVLDDVTNGEDPAVGKRVAFIGGGNVVMDVGRVARRFGAEVTILHRRGFEDTPVGPEEIHDARSCTPAWPSEQFRRRHQRYCRRASGCDWNR